MACSRVLFNPSSSCIVTKLFKTRKKKKSQIHSTGYARGVVTRETANGRKHSKVLVFYAKLGLLWWRSAAGLHFRGRFENEAFSSDTETAGGPKYSNFKAPQFLVVASGRSDPSPKFDVIARYLSDMNVSFHVSPFTLVLYRFPLYGKHMHALRTHV